MFDKLVERLALKLTGRRLMPATPRTYDSVELARELRLELIGADASGGEAASLEVPSVRRVGTSYDGFATPNEGYFKADDERMADGSFNRCTQLVTRPSALLKAGHVSTHAAYLLSEDIRVMAGTINTVLGQWQDALYLLRTKEEALKQVKRERRITVEALEKELASEKSRAYTFKRERDMARDELARREEERILQHGELFEIERDLRAVTDRLAGMHDAMEAPTDDDESAVDGERIKHPADMTDDELADLSDEIDRGLDARLDERFGALSKSVKGE